MAKADRDRVFLSYAHEDLDTVRRIYVGLKERQLNVWFDKEHLSPGEWMPQIEKAIPRSRYFVICISNAALQKTGDDEREFELSRHDRFRYRTRYFTDSGVIGSKEFVSKTYLRFKHVFNSKNDKTPKAIKGLSGVYSLKRLSEIV